MAVMVVVAVLMAVIVVVVVVVMAVMVVVVVSMQDTSNDSNTPPNIVSRVPVPRGPTHRFEPLVMSLKAAPAVSLWIWYSSGLMNPTAGRPCSPKLATIPDCKHQSAPNHHGHYARA